MEEEKCAVDLIASVANLYNDYSQLAYQDAQKVLNSQLKRVRFNFQSLMKIPPSDRVVRRKLSICSALTRDQIEFNFLKWKDGSDLRLNDTIHFKRIKSIISQILDNSTKSQLTIMISHKLLELIQLYEKRSPEAESSFLKLLEKSLMYEYQFNRTISLERDERDPRIKPLKFETDDFVLLEIYNRKLVTEVLNLPTDIEEGVLQEEIRRAASECLELFSARADICYFYSTRISKELDALFTEFLQLFSSNKFEDLQHFVESFSTKHPVLPELVLLFNYQKENPQLFNNTAPLSNSPIVQSEESVNLIIALLTNISASFKYYELYDRDIEEPGLPKLNEFYYEFKFPEIFKWYLKLLFEDDIELQNDPYFSLVCYEVLKYRDSEITPDCWDFQLHNLCKIMFGMQSDIPSIKFTVYHKLAVFMYTKSQAVKRKYLLIWSVATESQQEQLAHLQLYQKVLKRRILSRWVKKFILMRSLDIQASRYKETFNRNLIFNKWHGGYQDIRELDTLANKVILSRYLTSWHKLSSRTDLEDAISSFLLKQKSKYFRHIVSLFERRKVLDLKADKFVMAKTVKKLSQRGVKFQKLELKYQIFVKSNYWKVWKRSLDILSTKSIVQAKNDTLLKSWFYGFWYRRTQEQRLCLDFIALRNEKNMKNCLFSMLVLAENQNIAELFDRRRLLLKAIKQLRLQLTLKTAMNLKKESLSAKFFKNWKLQSRLMLLHEITYEDLEKSFFALWKSKTDIRKEQRLQQLEDLYKSAAPRFAQTRKSRSLKVCLYKWEEKTIDVLQKQNSLQEIYGKSITEKHIKPKFQKWRSKQFHVKELSLRALRFEKDVAYLNFLGLMLDKADDIDYLYQVCNEQIEISDLRLLSLMFKRWSLLSMKANSLNRLVDEFKRRSNVSMLKNFLSIWKVNLYERNLLRLGSELGDDSLDHSSIIYSPLLFRRQQNTPLSSTPLLSRVGNLHSPSRRGGNLVRTPPSRQRTPGRISNAASITLNSENFRKNAMLEFRSRYQNVKISPTRNGVSDTSFTKFPNNVIVSPPTQPAFGDREASNRAKSHQAKDLSLDTGRIFDTEVPQNRRIQTLIETAIAAPKVSPLSEIRERMKNRTSPLYDLESRGDEVPRTRSSSLTFVDTSLAQDEGEVFGNFSNDKISPYSSRHSFRDLFIRSAAAGSQ